MGRRQQQLRDLEHRKRVSQITTGLLLNPNPEKPPAHTSSTMYGCGATCEHTSRRIARVSGSGSEPTRRRLGRRLVAGIWERTVVSETSAEERKERSPVQVS